MPSRFGKSIYNRAAWRRARTAALERDGWRCRRCGRAGRLEVHHVRRLAQGGAAFDLANLEALCAGCHLGEHGTAPRETSETAQRRQAMKGWALGTE